MKRKNLHVIGKKYISITMIIIILVTLMSTLFTTKVHAVTQSRNIESNNIDSINETLYPGYAEALRKLKSTHPNWTFTLFYTDLEWIDVLRNETIADHTRSLVGGKTGEWLCTYPECDGIPHDSTTFFGASQTAVAYYMDPRNFLTEEKIFQFENLSYIPTIHTIEGVEAILKGTFMSNKKICDYYNKPEYGDKTFGQVIMAAAQESKVSPYHLASRIRQEVGVNGSGSTSGKVSGYEGYFNFYNICAFAGKNPVENGLKYAKGESVNWNTPEKSIVGGAKWIANGYISIGQDSLYLQKWDVDSRSGLYGHQYMQNIQAPASEASSIYKSYKAIFNDNLSNTTFNFVIPMYKNISKTVSRYPSSSTYVSQNAELNTNSVVIRKTANGDAIGTYNKGYSLLRIELKAETVNGNAWDKVMLPNGTIGYVESKYVTEKTNVSEISKVAYINAVSNLLNAPRIIDNGSTLVKLLYKWQEVTIVEEGKYTFDNCQWVKIRLSDGTMGYIQKNYVTEGTYGEKVKLTCASEVALRETPQGDIIKYISNGKILTRVEKATQKKGGYYWDKVITSDGIEGYMAREKYSPYTLWLTPISADGKIMKNDTEKTIKAIPNTSFTEIKASYPSAVLVSGTENLGTGAKIRIDGIEFVIIKLGDVNGDGKINSGDLLVIQKDLLGAKKIEDTYKLKAADPNNDNKMNSADLLKIQKYLLNAGNITL